MLDPGNMDASKGLYRLSTAIQEKNEIKKKEFNQIEKTKGTS